MRRVEINRTSRRVFLYFFVLGSQAAFAASASKQEIDKTLQRFIRAPHPMGSSEQKKLATEYEQQFKMYGWAARQQIFHIETPNPASPVFGGRGPTSTPTTLSTEGRNVIATRAGSLPCAVIVGGHYDTKRFEEFKFVGANDGGSSTAMILEAARLLGKPSQQKNAVLQNCDLHFVLFDGEESILYGWTMATERGFKHPDNLYGSRVFAEDIKSNGKMPAMYQKKIVAGAFVFDMIGHKQQKLSITSGSDPKLSQGFLVAAKKLKINIDATDQYVEDDHVSLAKKGVRFVHVIDWSNLNEWHTAKDTLDIIDSSKIAAVTNAFVAYLKETPYEK